MKILFVRQRSVKLLIFDFDKFLLSSNKSMWRRRRKRKRWYFYFVDCSIFFSIFDSNCFLIICLMNFVGRHWKRIEQEKYEFFSENEKNEKRNIVQCSTWWCQSHLVVVVVVVLVIDRFLIQINLKMNFENSFIWRKSFLKWRNSSFFPLISNRKFYWIKMQKTFDL